ncbi:MAG: hypothetical protein GY835_14595 [bacterium]|nr:hypothetical protein [bacterium]
MTSRRLRLFGVLVPYGAVLVGLYLLRHAWAAILLYHVGILSTLLLNRQNVHPGLLFRGWNRGALLATLPVALLGGPALLILWPWLRSGEGLLAAWMQSHHLTGTGWIVFIIYFSLIHPLLEELHWRTLTARAALRPCRLDAAFAGYHVLVLLPLLRGYWLAIGFLLLLGASLFWRWSARRFGGHAVPLVTHAVADASIILFTALLLSGMPGR